MASGINPQETLLIHRDALLVHNTYGVQNPVLEAVDAPSRTVHKINVFIANMSQRRSADKIITAQRND